jgi:hypothetical protein
MLHRMALFVQLRKTERAKNARARRHYKHSLCRKVVVGWLGIASQRGGQLRMLRKILNGWWTYVRSVNGGCLHAWTDDFYLLFHCCFIVV